MPEFGMMTPSHLLYIPVVLVSGILLGWHLGARAATAEFERRQRRMKE
jgi:hypothetical protein